MAADADDVGPCQQRVRSGRAPPHGPAGGQPPEEALPAQRDQRVGARDAGPARRPAHRRSGANSQPAAPRQAARQGRRVERLARLVTQLPAGVTLAPGS